MVKKGGKGKFKLVLAFLLVQPSSERGQFDDSVSVFPWQGLGWEWKSGERGNVSGVEARDAVRVPGLVSLGLDLN